MADQLAPPETRPGNESAIVPVLAIAAGTPAGRRWRSRRRWPPVPGVRTPEPGAEPLHFPLDLTPFLPAGARSPRGVRHERVAAGALLARLPRDRRRAGRSPGPWSRSSPATQDAEIPIPNPDDRAALGRRAPGRAVAPRWTDRFLVYLAGQHPYRDRLFVAATTSPLPPGDRSPRPLPPAAGRWVYRVRGGGRGQVTSRPDRRPPRWSCASRRWLAGAPPMRAPRQLGDAAGAGCGSASRPTRRVSHLLIFHAPSVGAGPVEVTADHPGAEPARPAARRRSVAPRSGRRPDRADGDRAGRPGGGRRAGREPADRA